MNAKFEDKESDEAQEWLQDQVINGHHTKKFEYGIEVPHYWEDVIRIDAETVTGIGKKLLRRR